MFINRFLILILALFFVLFFYDRLKAEEKIKEPNLTRAIAWMPHKTLGLILKFKTDKNTFLYFAHPIIGFPMSRKDCNFIQVNKYGAKALTNGVDVFEYNFSKDATMYRNSLTVNWKPYITKINANN